MGTYFTVRGRRVSESTILMQARSNFVFRGRLLPPCLSLIFSGPRCATLYLIGLANFLRAHCPLLGAPSGDHGPYGLWPLEPVEPLEPLEPLASGGDHGPLASGLWPLCLVHFPAPEHPNYARTPNSALLNTFSQVVMCT